MQQKSEGNGGIVKILASRSWTEWLPIYAWLIEHAEGLIVVDTGETARTSESGYFPRWQPYYRFAVRMDVSPAQEIGPQLRNMGFNPEDVNKVILTHLHTDHAGGMAHFPHSELVVSGDEYKNATGFSGKVQGYLPHRWPDWFSPTPIQFAPSAYGPFDASYPVTEAGDVVIIPTPGHTPSHVSVMVQIDGISYLLAGDTSYSEALLLARQPDGVSPKADVAVQTMDKILHYAAEHPMVYLPSHDPWSGDRLRDRQILTPVA